MIASPSVELGKRKLQGAQSSGSSLEESLPSETGETPFADPITPDPKSQSEGDSGVEAKPDGPAAPSPPSKASSTGSKRERDSQLSRGTHKADREKEDRKMLEMLGSLEHGHLKPKPIFPQAILGHLYMRKFGLNREQRAHIIRSTNGSSRLEDIERIVRASDLEEFRSERRVDDRQRPPKQQRRDTMLIDEDALLAEDDSSDLWAPDDDLETDSGDAFLANEDDPSGETDQELQEIYEVQKKAKKEFRKSFKTYKESRKKVREIKKNRTPYLPVVALNQSPDATPSGQSPVARQTFGGDRRSASSKPAPKRRSDSKFPSRKEEANLATSTVVEQFSYMVECQPQAMLHEDVWLTSVPDGYAIIDTGCTTSIVGSETADRLRAYLESQGWPQPVSRTLPPVELKGFNGTKEETTNGLKWAVKLGSLWGTITTYMIPGAAPFLLSRRVLEGMDAKLDLGRQTITSTKHGMHDVPLRQASNGHLLLPLLELPADLSVSEEIAHAEHETNENENEPNTCPVPDRMPESLPRKTRVSTSDRRRVFQHIVKNTRKGVVNAERFQKELQQLFGGRGKDIRHCFVAYRPRLERIPTDAGTRTYDRSVASLTSDGELHVSPWNQRLPGESRRQVIQVNACLFAYIPTDCVEAADSHHQDSHHDHHCFCCRVCDSEGEEIRDTAENPLEESTYEVTTETLYGEEIDWSGTQLSTMQPEDQRSLAKSIQAMRKTYAQFILSRLQGNQDDLIAELSEWLGPAQAHELHGPKQLIEVFTGQAPLSNHVEKLGGSSIRIGLDHGQDLSLHEHRRKLMLLIAYCRPRHVWISFPCGCWGPWSRMNMSRDAKSCERVENQRRLARRYLSLVPEIWSFQQSLGGHTHVENPLSSDAWKEFKLTHAFAVRIDQCSVGLRCPKTNLPVMKPTRIVTSCESLATRLHSCRCDQKHSHAHLEGNYKGKPLTSYAETYPRKMCRVIAEVLCAKEHSQPAVHDVFAELDDEPLVEQELPIEKQRIQAMIRKLHVNTGHASTEQMLRLANRCQVSPEVKQGIKDFTCAICEDHKVPVSHRQSAIPHADTPNQIVGADYVQVELKHINDRGVTEEVKFNVLTCVDLATDFAQQIIVRKGTPIAKAFHEVWTRPYGAPKILYTDPAGGTLSADLQDYLLRHSIQLL